MDYIKIPIKSVQDGVELAEEHLGTMCWRRMDDGSLEAYPYDDDNPVYIVSNQPPRSPKQRGLNGGGIQI